MSISDYLSIIDILITILVGFVISHMVSLRDSRNRAVKDYYIKELSELKTEINCFYSNLLKDMLSAPEIIAWHQTIRNRIYSFDKSLNEVFDLHVYPINKKLFNNLKIITDSDTFNDDFSKSNIVFKGEIRNKISNSERSLYSVINNTLFDINNVSSPDYIRRKYKEFRKHYSYYRSVKKKNIFICCWKVFADWCKCHLTIIVLLIVFVLAGTSLINRLKSVITERSNNNNSEVIKCDTTYKSQINLMGFGNDTVVDKADKLCCDSINFINNN